MSGLGILGVITTSMVGLGLAESVWHRRRLKSIPTRIHISGTRGKSSVTRLLAAAMRHAGIATAAKTTGTLPRLILPDGREVPVFRPSGANIIEQTRIVAAAADMQARALIVECMALRPELHWISENKLIRATHGVITNARADHLDVMGPTEVDVAKTLAGMIPVNGLLFTAEQRHLDILRQAAQDRNTTCLAVSPEAIDAITDSDLNGFCYKEHAENVALVLMILEHFGIPRQVAMEGMWQAHPDPGALTEYEMDFFGRKIFFVNGFAANDPESTARIWNMMQEKYHDVDTTVAVFNMRADRPSRTVQLARETDFWHGADKVILIGSGAYLFSRMAAKTSCDDTKLIYADYNRVEEIFESILEQCSGRTLVVGMGNIGEQGLELNRYFKNRSIQRQHND